MNIQQTKTLKSSPEFVIHRSWDEDRSLCLGGAGASLAVLLTIFQLSVNASIPEIKQLHGMAAGLASMSIALWVCLWQVGDTNAYWRSKYPERSNKTPLTKIWGPCLFATASAFLIASISVMLSLLSATATLAFLLTAGVSVMLAIKHSLQIQKHMKHDEGVVRRLRKIR